MLYKDAVTDSDYARLSEQRGLCLSIYLPTARLPQETQGDRILFKNLINQALQEALDISAKRTVAPIEEALTDLLDDEGFWRHRADGLAVLATPESLRTFRLAYPVAEKVEVADRFYLKPLVPALRPKSAFVLAISQKSVTLYEYTGRQELVALDVPDMPSDLSDATGRALQMDRSPAGRLQGDEGKKVLQRQFLREVEAAVRPVVANSNMWLILAADRRLQDMYRSLSNYEMLAPEGIEGSVEGLPLEELRQAVEPIVRQLRTGRLERWAEEYDQREAEGRTSSDLATIARFATFGQVGKLLVATEPRMHGTIGDDGSVTPGDPLDDVSYDLFDEIVARVIANGGEVVSVRDDEEGPFERLLPISAILRWAP